MRLLNLRFRRTLTAFAAVAFVVLGLSACGKNYYFSGRALPPSGILNRVMIAAQIGATGQVSIVDALYDVRHNFNNTVPFIPVGGYSGTALPVSIQNLPAQQVGLIFASSNGQLSSVNYQAETAATLLAPGSPGQIPSSIFANQTEQYIVAALQQQHYLQMYDVSATPASFLLNLPNVYRVAINPAGTVALAFLENSDLVYSVVHLTAAQQTLAINKPTSFRITLADGSLSQPSEDCEPQNLPQYCVFPVSAGTARFDRPIRAVFSPDGASAYVIDCGPECGGASAGVTQIPLGANALNAGAQGPAGVALMGTRFIPVPGGATDALFNGNTLYVAGQQQLPDGLFTGELSVVDAASGSVSTPTPISDGTHQRMVLADDNTLWIGSNNCQGGERYRQAQAGQSTPYGCMSVVDTGTNQLRQVLSFKGDGTGIAAVTGLHKVYTAEGGQVYIYGTKSLNALDNSNVTVQGTAVDVAYMDAPDNSDNTWY